MDACPVCQNVEISKDFTVTREDLYARCLPESLQVQARYNECSICHCHYLSVPNMDDSAYVSGAYYNVDAKDDSFFQQRFDKIISLPKGKSDNLERVERIHKFVGASDSERNVLDVGAGLGIFLRQFVTGNWRGTAIELDPRLCEHMSSNLKNVEIRAGALANQKFDKKFDLITLNRVLEHIEQPAKFLKQCHGLLKAGGHLYLELPDTRSYDLDSANNEAYGYGHYAVYSPDGVCKVAFDSGFDLDHLSRVQEPSTKFTLYSFLSPKKTEIKK